MTEVLVALPFGLLIGLSLGLVGGGGSILAVPVLVYVLGEDVKEATTASLLIVGATALVGALDHARGGRVRWRAALVFGVAGAAGSLAGTALNRVASPESILFVFALILLGAAYAMVRRDEPCAGEETEARGRDLWLKVVPAGLVVGAMTGFFGVGGGFLIVPVLALLLGLATPVAIGTSLLVIALTSAAALAAHLSSGGLDWTLAAGFAGAGVVGALGGSRLSEHLSSGRLKAGFAVLVAGVGVFLLVKNVTVLTG